MSCEKVLILSKRYSRDSQILYSAATKAGWRTWRFNSSIPDWIKQARPVIYCESVYAEYLAHELKLELLTPGDRILSKLDYKYVKRNIIYSSYKDLNRPKKRVFIKPADYKYFPAGVYDANAEIPGLSYCQPNDPILISDIVNFVDEYRFFILNNTIMTGSIYVKHSEFVGDDDTHYDLNDDLLSFTQQVVNDYQNELPSSYVIDVGRLNTGEWAVIEFNPTWGSGIYGADENKVLECLCESSK